MGDGSRLCGSFGAGKVPLVHKDDAGAPLTLNHVGDVLVLRGRADFSVHHQDGHVALAHGLLTPEEGEALHRRVNLVHMAHTGGVNEGVVARGRAGTDGEGHVHAVTRRPGHIADDDAVAAQQAVDVTALAGVRTPHDGHAQGLGLGRTLRLGLFRQMLQHLSHEGFHATTMRRRDGKDGKGQLGELVGAMLMARQVALVRGHHTGATGLAHQTGDFLIGRLETGLRVHHQNDARGIGQGHGGLVTHGHFNDVPLLDAIKESDTAGVDESELLVVPRHLPHDAITRHPALVMHNGDTPMRDTVKERGLAHIGPPHDCHCPVQFHLRFHASYFSKIPPTPQKHRPELNTVREKDKPQRRDSCQKDLKEAQARRR